MTSDCLPHRDAEIVPWMPSQLHDSQYGNKFFGDCSIGMSPVGYECRRRNLSVHDRYKVYEEMKAAEKNGH